MNATPIAAAPAPSSRARAVRRAMTRSPPLELGRGRVPVVGRRGQRFDLLDVSAARHGVSGPQADPDREAGQGRTQEDALELGLASP